MTIDLQQKKLEIMHQLMHVVPNHGWCNTAMEEASVSLGHDKHYASLLFIGGINEAVDFYLSYIDHEMLLKVQAMDLTNSKTPELSHHLKRVPVSQSFLLPPEPLWSYQVMISLLPPFVLLSQK